MRVIVIGYSPPMSAIDTVIDGVRVISKKRGYLYTVLASSGASFTFENPEYLGGFKDVLQLPDDMCQIDSGWLHWQCDKCGAIFWTRSRHCGIVICQACGNQGEVPSDARMYPYEGASDYEEVE